MASTPTRWISFERPRKRCRFAVAATCSRVEDLDSPQPQEYLAGNLRAGSKDWATGLWAANKPGDRVNRLEVPNREYHVRDRSLSNLPATACGSRQIPIGRNSSSQSRNCCSCSPSGWLSTPYGWTQRDLIAQSGSEAWTTSLFKKLLEPGNLYVDIGCHVGFHTLVARTQGWSSGKIVAVDPQSNNCDKVLTNWCTNGFDSLARTLRH